MPLQEKKQDIPLRKWKSVDNFIKETLPSGEERVRLIPVAAWQTPEAMRELVTRFKEEIDLRHVHELILIAAFILDFLIIHPFSDGNGRMARLLTLLLLYQSGYDVGRYISLERIVEESKEQYYDTLHRSSLNWYEGNHDVYPWLEYFLGVILKAYQRLQQERIIPFDGKETEGKHDHL